MAVDNEDSVAVNGDCKLLILVHRIARNIHGMIHPKLSLCRESRYAIQRSFHSRHIISIKTLSTLDAWSHCDKRTMQSHLVSAEVGT
jgi:hypothetical protein